LQARVRVNEAMAWFMSDFYLERTSMVYPQVFPHHSAGREKSLRWRQILNDSWIAKKKTLPSDKKVKERFNGWAA